MTPFRIVAAVDSALGIGRDGTIPWRIPGDVAWFRELTVTRLFGARNAVVMGRRTWESIPPRFRPLPNRDNIVLSRRGFDAHAHTAVDLDSALEVASRLSSTSVFVIGGAEVYGEAIRHPGCRGLYLTRVDGDWGCDTRFPVFMSDYRLTRDVRRGDHPVSWWVQYWRRNPLQRSFTTQYRI